jgi:hypothetical protein
MRSRGLIQSSAAKKNLITTMVFLAMLLTAGLVSTSWAGGIPWQVGDVVVCYGGGNCNVLRIHGTSVQLLDTISDGISGNTGGVGLNNTLHVVATDDHGGGQSKVVVYSIASINPFLGTVLTHSVINTPYDASGSPGDSAAAVAMNSAGHIFVGNAKGTSSFASIVELDAHGNPTGNVFAFPTTGDCATNTLGSLDINANADAIYVTAKDGVIRKVSLPLSVSSSCSQFANFGSGVTLFGIKDIPAGALTGTCGSNPPNPASNPCPSDESVLVVATGFTDPDSDTNETGEPALPNDPDAVNICTNQTDEHPVSCALLLDTTGAGLTAQPWVAKTLYPTTGTAILDPHSHVQQVFTAGTSGADEPAFGQSATTLDNAVKWTDLNPQPSWQHDHVYAVGALPSPTVAAVPNTYFVDPNGNLQTVTGAGTSGPTEPGTGDNPVSWSTAAGGITIDGLQWQDQGTWLPSHLFSGSAVVGDTTGHLHGILTPGTSGITQPIWVINGGATNDNAVTWTDQGNWQPNTKYYSLTQAVGDIGFHLHKVNTPGRSNTNPSATTPVGGWLTGTTTNDNEVMWINLGTPGTWAPQQSYSNGSIVSESGIIQQVTSSGMCTSGGSSGDTTPNQSTSGWNQTSGGQTSDGGCTWTDLGSPGTWAADTPYGVGQIVAEACGDFQCVQQVTMAGTSGPTDPGTPLVLQPFSGWNQTVGSSTTDGLTWTDEGLFAWQSSHPYTKAASSTDPHGVVVDPAGHAQQVIADADGGTSGPFQPGTTALSPPNPNPWTDGASPLGGRTIDGLQWTDQGLHVWIAGQSYVRGDLISDQASPLAHVQKVYEAGTSGTGSAPAFDHSGGFTPDNVVTWTESHPMRASTQPYVLNAIVVDTFSPTHVQQVSLAGTTGPAASFAFSDSGGTEIDGLQWTDQPMPSVLARYPVAGVATLQSLALDPLVANCTGNGCPTLPLPSRKVTNSNPLVAASFWLGDFGSGNIYRQSFAGGSPTLFSADTGAGRVQSLIVYGGEGANQAGLASLVLNGSLATPLFTASAQFLQNTITSTLYPNGSTPLPTTTPISLYASLVDKTSCFNDPSAGNLACKPTASADTTKALVWKLDVPLNDTAALPLTETLNTSFAAFANFGIDNSTDVFVDEQFDDTTFVGADPGTRTISVHSLHEVASVSQTAAQCTYSSPLQNGCYKTNRATLNFTFTCPGLSQTQFQHMHPSLSLVKKNPPPQSPQFIPLTGTNSKAPYRFNSAGNFWTFQWNLNGATAGTYKGTTFDSPGPGDNPSVQSFPVTFVLKNSCP